MTHERARARQEELLDEVCAILRSDPRVAGVVLAGSCARGENDAFSDIDVACVLADEALPGRQELYDAVSGLAPLLCRLWIYDTNALYLFEDGVRLDLDFVGPSKAPGAWFVRSDARVLHDPRGLLAASLAGRGPRLPDHPKWFAPGEQAFLEWFFWMVRQIVCWAKRSAQGGARAYDKLAAAVGSLGEVRTRLVETRLWTLGSAEPIGAADPTCAAALALTFPRFDPAEVVSCARRLLDEYERIGPAYCARAGVEFPARKAGVLRSLVAEFEALS